MFSQRKGKATHTPIKIKYITFNLSFLIHTLLSQKLAFLIQLIFLKTYFTFSKVGIFNSTSLSEYILYFLEKLILSHTVICRLFFNTYFVLSQANTNTHPLIHGVPVDGWNSGEAGMSRKDPPEDCCCGKPCDYFHEK